MGSSSITDEMLEFYRNKEFPTQKGKDLEALVSSFDSLRTQISNRPEEAKKLAQEMVNLYKVNKDNFNSVDRQWWGSRLVNTLTGKNERLREKNLENLLQIQTRGLFFVEQLAIDNEIFRQCILGHSAEIESLQCDNVEIRKILISLFATLKERFKKYDTHVDGYSEEILTLEQKDILIHLMAYLAKIDDEVSPQEELLLKNKIKRLGLSLSYEDIPQYRLQRSAVYEVLLNELSKYDKLTKAIIYKNLVEMVHCDKKKEEREEQELSKFKPYLGLDEQDLAKIEKDVREYIMGGPEAYVYLHSKDKRIKITPEDFKPHEEKKQFEEDKIGDSSLESSETSETESGHTTELNPEALMKLGWDCLEKGEYEEARRHFEKVLEYNPKSAPAYKGLGISVLSLADSLAESQQEPTPDVEKFAKQAIECLNKSIELNPNDAEVYYLLGDFFCGAEEYSEALTYLRQALRLQPDLIAVHESLIKILKESGEGANIIEEYHDLLGKYPNNPYLYWGLGRAYFESWETEKAIKNLEKAISLKPDFYEAHLSLGQIYMDWWGGEQDYGKAVSKFAYCVNLVPERGEGYYHLAIAYHKDGRHKKAVDTYRKLKELDYDLVQELYNEIKGSIEKGIE